MEAFHWPQWVMLVATLIGIGMRVSGIVLFFAKIGKVDVSRPIGGLIATALTQYIIWAGGFWG